MRDDESQSKPSFGTERCCVDISSDKLTTPAHPLRQPAQLCCYCCYWMLYPLPPSLPPSPTFPLSLSLFSSLPSLPSLPPSPGPLALRWYVFLLFLLAHRGPLELLHQLPALVHTVNVHMLCKGVVCIVKELHSLSGSGVLHLGFIRERCAFFRLYRGT